MTRFFLYLILLFPLTTTAQEIRIENGPSLSPPPIRRVDTRDIPENMFERKVQKLTDYTGFAIELTQSAFPIPKTSSSLNKFGKVYYQYLDGTYRYLILIDFNKKKAIKKFMKQVIYPKQPNAKVTRYLDGVRTSEYSW